VKRPTRVKVGPFDFRIEYVDLELADRSGSFEPKTLRILIDNDVPVPVQRHILLHELMHACVFVSDEPESETEEAYVRVISGQLLAVLRDNPKVATWLSE
jgi:hypothetical protein